MQDGGSARRNVSRRHGLLRSIKVIAFAQNKISRIFVRHRSVMNSPSIVTVCVVREGTN